MFIIFQNILKTDGFKNKIKLNHDDYLKTMFQTIMGAGHHIYADKSEIFNETVNSICQFADEASDSEDGLVSFSAVPSSKSPSSKQSLSTSPDHNRIESPPPDNLGNDQVDKKNKLS